MKTAGAGAAAAGMAGMAGKDLLGQIFPPGVQAAKKPPPEPGIPIDSAIIIGAGPAGLTAASLIADHGDTVTVIESCHRPGGRIQVGEFPNGQHFSVAGSEWFACDDDFEWLVKDYLGFASNQIGTWNANTYFWWKDQYCYCSGGWTSCVNGCLPLSDPGKFWDYETESKKFYDCILTEPMDDPESCWLGTKKDPWDTGNYWDWMVNKYDASMADLCGNIFFGSELAVPPSMASEALGNYCMAYWYWDNCYSLYDGNYQIIEALMSRIPSGSVKLNETVSSVTNTATGVEVVSNKGTYTADIAIVSVPHINVAGIVPELPSARVNALDDMHDTHAILAALQFTERFWDTQFGMGGWGGVADWLTTTDATMFQTGAEGILECYITESQGKSLELWQSHNGIHVTGGKATIVDAILAKLDEFWPATQYYNGNAKVYEWIPYVPNYPPGFVRDGRYTTLRDPIDKIYFAGEYCYGPGLSSAVHIGKDTADKFE
ncbi:MAG: FAD-dependent oxidoreductase [Candidatus Bathyarchaeota archaeon]|nr:MAG: FAD-dependent oxidoreductase [Candidatus Bathyarchaeota archaeon]